MTDIDRRNDRIRFIINQIVDEFAQPLHPKSIAISPNPAVMDGWIVDFSHGRLGDPPEFNLGVLLALSRQLGTENIRVSMGTLLTNYRIVGGRLP